MERIEIDKATAEQLRAFGDQVLGLELGGRENRQTMIGKMAEVGYGLEFISLPPSAPVPSGGPRQNGAFSVRPNIKGGNEVRIIIHTQDVPGGDRPVQVGVNGKLMLIPRGREVWVPEAYVEVLDHAEENIYSEYSPNDGGLGGLKAPRVFKSYPFSFA